MKNHPMMWRVLSLVVALFAALSLTLAPVLAPDFNLTPVFADSDDDDDDGNCNGLPTAAQLLDAVTAAVTFTNALVPNVGLRNDAWATIVDADGVVCAVVFTGGDRNDQWPGSRIISAQKAFGGYAFSLDANASGTPIALSTANLYASTQPGGGLFGLQFSNLADAKRMLSGDPEDFGTGDDDPLVGRRAGGLIVFGGGLALYESSDELLGGLGESGDTACRDHINAWITRDALGLDNIPGGVAPGGTDNIIYDNISADPNHFRSASGFGHVECSDAETRLSNVLPACFPIGPTVGPVGPCLP